VRRLDVMDMDAVSLTSNPITVMPSCSENKWDTNTPGVVMVLNASLTL
jgi:hypothetical protein